MMNGTRLIFLLASVLLIRPAAGHAQDNDPFLRREGRHIKLTTDLESAAEAEALVAAFDAAVPQWSKFWNLPPGVLADWKVDAYVMSDRSEFQRRNMIPNRIPDFPFGYASGNQLWVIVQPSQYYTRHLLLHEGVHSLAFKQFGGAGPTWFMEGTAELLATHRGEGSNVVINQVPASREAVPHWGRFALIRQRREEAHVPTIETVMRYQPNLKGDVESYGWSWAAAMLLEAYPEYRNAFHAAANNGRDTSHGFTKQLYQRLALEWPAVSARWQLMCHELDYGFDWERERVNLSARDRVWNGKPVTIEVAADHGWQSIGGKLAAGATVKLSGEGQCVLRMEERPWVSQPAGVTIEYHRGRPIGQLLACVVPVESDSQPNVRPLETISVASEATISIKQQSWLLLRINEAGSDLHDNSGGYQVTCRQ